MCYTNCYCETKSQPHIFKFTSFLLILLLLVVVSTYISRLCPTLSKYNIFTVNKDHNDKK